MNIVTARQVVAREGRILRGLLEQSAARITRDYGWYPTDGDVPADYAGLLGEFATAGARGGAVRISHERCETAPYGVVGNVLFRFIHDSHHYGLRRSFSIHDEHVVNCAVFKHLFKTHRVPNARAMNMTQLVYWFDTFGQTEFAGIRGGFVPDQSEFIAQCLVGFHIHPDITDSTAVTIAMINLDL